MLFVSHVNSLLATQNFDGQFASLCHIYK